MDTMASLTAALTVNTQLLQGVLQQQQYEEAQSYMDERLILIEKLRQLARIDPAQQQDIAIWIDVQLVQEQEMIRYAYSQHQAVFQQLTQISRANKAEQAYRMNIQES